MSNQETRPCRFCSALFRTADCPRSCHHAYDATELRSQLGAAREHSRLHATRAEAIINMVEWAVAGHRQNYEQVAAHMTWLDGQLNNSRPADIVEPLWERCNPVDNTVAPAVPDEQQNNIRKAVEFAARYGVFEGEHHKQWVIDQMLRALLSSEYDAWATAQNADPDYTPWDVGRAP